MKQKYFRMFRSTREILFRAILILLFSLLFAFIGYFRSSNLQYEDLVILSSILYIFVSGIYIISENFIGKIICKNRLFADELSSEYTVHTYCLIRSYTITTSFDSEEDFINYITDRIRLNILLNLLPPVYVFAFLVLNKYSSLLFFMALIMFFSICLRYMNKFIQK